MARDMNDLFDVEIHKLTVAFVCMCENNYELDIYNNVTLLYFLQHDISSTIF